MRIFSKRELIKIGHGGIQKMDLASKHVSGLPGRRKRGFLGMNGVALARYGLIFNHNEATGSRKVCRYLPGLRDTIFISKMAAKVPKSKNPANYHIF